MAFFKNDTVNLLNLHHGLHALALSGGGAFIGVFLLRAGVPAPLVLAAMALVNLGRFALRPLMLAPARRWGLKPLAITGVLLCTLQYPLLAGVHGPGWWAWPRRSPPAGRSRPMVHASPSGPPHRWCWPPPCRWSSRRM